jgi:hypothetical protein
MFARDGHTATLDLSHWLGPLNPTFAALAAQGEHEGSTGDGHERVASTDHELLGAPVAAPVAAPPAAAANPDNSAELRKLFHTLNNQLGVILTYAELLEAKAPDQALRSRANQIVTATLDALGTTKALRATIVR